MENKTNFENLLSLIEDIQTNKESYLRASKQVRDSIIQINEDFKKSLTEINQNFSNTFNDLQKDIFKNFEVFKSYTFQRNLFSEEAIKSFKQIYRFEDDIVFQAQQTIRDLYINPTTISTLTETINSTYPINENNTYNRYDEFINTLKNDHPHPFKKVIRWTSGIAAGKDVEIFATNYIYGYDLHVQNSLLFVIVCLITYLATYYPYFKN